MTGRQRTDRLTDHRADRRNLAALLAIAQGRRSREDEISSAYLKGVAVGVTVTSVVLGMGVLIWHIF